MAQNVNPIESAQAHPNLGAPPGTKRYTVESCDDGGGGCFIAYPIPAHSHLDTRQVGQPLAQAGQVRVRYVPAGVAAVDLAWSSTSPAPRLATDEEIEQYRREHGGT
jgi:hypothetical protein